METTDHLLIRSLISKIGPVDMEKIIAADKLPNGSYIIKLNSKRIEDGEASALKKEAELIEQMQLFKLLTETLRYQAQRMMFEQSQKAEDVFISGKFLLHAISTFEHIIWACKNPQFLMDEIKLSTGPSRKKVPSNKKGVIS